MESACHCLTDHYSSATPLSVISVYPSACAQCGSSMVQCDRCGWTGIDLMIHRGLSPLCSGALGLNALQVLQQARASVSTENHNLDAGELESRALFRGTTRDAMLEHLAWRRFDALDSGTSLAAGKEFVTTAMDLVKPELHRRLQSSMTCSDDFLRDTIADVCDVFGQLQPPNANATDGSYASIYSEAREMRAHEQKFAEAAVKPTERTLGWRGERSMDAEGQAFGPVRLKRAFCFDVAVDATLRRLMQCDARAWAQVEEASERWQQNPPEEGAEETVFFDIPDGEFFRSHPELGIDAPRDGSVKLAFILYYDGLGITNPLGAFSTKHTLGCFYYALVNLEPGIRMAMPYIQLVTVAYESDIKHFGAELVLSGPLDEDEETGTSFGACMRRLARPSGITLDVPDPTATDGPNPGFRAQIFRGWTVLLAADHPAAAKLLFFKESVAARKPCRSCDWDQ